MGGFGVTTGQTVVWSVDAILYLVISLHVYLLVISYLQATFRPVLDPFNIACAMHKPSMSRILLSRLNTKLRVRLTRAPKFQGGIPPPSLLLALRSHPSSALVKPSPSSTSH